MMSSTRQLNRDRTGLSSQYRGVGWHKKNYKWQATIWMNGKLRHLGYYEDEEDAARAYDRAAREAWGPNAVVNFPEPSFLAPPARYLADEIRARQQSHPAPRQFVARERPVVKRTANRATPTPSAPNRKQKGVPTTPPERVAG
jgi:hypothetical protein